MSDFAGTGLLPASLDRLANGPDGSVSVATCILEITSHPCDFKVANDCQLSHHAFGTHQHPVRTKQQRAGQ